MVCHFCPLVEADLVTDSGQHIDRPIDQSQRCPQLVRDAREEVHLHLGEPLLTVQVILGGLKLHLLHPAVDYEP